MKRTLKILIPIICINILVYVFLDLKSAITEEETVYIAFVGPLGRESIQDSANAVAMYLDKLNAAGGVDGKKIELRLYDDNDNEADAEKIARQIAAEKKALLVLGHTSSHTSIVAGKIYDLHGIPAVTASATEESVTAGNAWYFRTIPNNLMQAASIANYLQFTLKKSSASIVYDERSYGSSLERNFRSAASKLGIKINGKWNFNPENPNLNTQLEWIVEDLMVTEDPGIIFMAVYTAEGTKIITKLKDAGKDFSFIGPDTFSNEDLIRNFNTYPKEKSAPGFYSNGIHSAAPFMSSIGDERAYAFRKSFLNKFGKEPPWIATCYYDAAHVVVEAIRRADIKGKDQIIGSRKKIRDALAGYYTIENAAEGITGSIFFDNNGDLNRPYVMGVYMKQTLLPAFTQYKPVGNPTVIKNLFERVLTGEYSVINGELMRKFNVTYMDGELLEIKNLDVQGGKCTLDFNVWFQYASKFNVEEINFTNAVTPIHLKDPLYEKTVNQITTRVHHVHADFWTDFNLYAYPFLSYMIPVGMRHISRTDNRMVHIPKLSHISGTELPVKEKRKKPMEGSPKWKVDNISYYREEILRRSGIGTSNLFRAQDGMNITQFNAEIRLKKEGWWEVIRVFLPPAVMLGIMYLAFFIPAHRFETRILLAVAVLTANAIYHINFLSYRPMAYSTPIDYVFLSVYVFAIMSIVLSLLIWRKYEKGEFRICKRLMTVGKAVYPFAVFCLAFLIGLKYRSPDPYGGL